MNDTLNDQAPWDEFDSQAYFEHNYQTLRADDKQILEAVRDHFGAHFAKNPDKKYWGIDVGAGTNLYPTLAMLPGCDLLTLVDHSASNVAWLEKELPFYGPNWNMFWSVLRENKAYQQVIDPRHSVASVAKVRRANLFDSLAWHWYDIGTMFFVAESLTTNIREFNAAVDRFADALVPGAPYAVAFMENSLGYQVGDTVFPACKVVESDIQNVLGERSADLAITRIDVPGELLRDGYTGMLLALGTINE